MAAALKGQNQVFALVRVTISHGLEEQRSFVKQQQRSSDCEQRLQPLWGRENIPFY